MKPTPIFRSAASRVSRSLQSRWPTGLGRLFAPGLALALAAAILGAASTAQAQNIDNRASINNTLRSFGIGTVARGQTITIPAAQTRISSFSIATVDVPSTASFEGVVMAWDGAKATGPVLYRSPLRSTTGATPQDVVFTPATPITVTPGATYVLFLSAANGVGTGVGGLAIAPGGSYPGGQAVDSRGTAEADWLQPWIAPFEADLGFTVTFAAPTPVPTLSEWAMIALGLTLAGGAALYIQRRRQTA